MLKKRIGSAGERMRASSAAILAVALFAAAGAPAYPQTASGAEGSVGDSTSHRLNQRSLWQRFSLQIDVDTAEGRSYGIGSLAVDPSGGADALVALISPAEVSREELNALVDWLLEQKNSQAFPAESAGPAPAGVGTSDPPSDAFRLLRLSGSVAIEDDGMGTLVLDQHELQIATGSILEKDSVHDDFVLGGFALGGIAVGRATPFSREIHGRIQGGYDADLGGNPRFVELLVQFSSYFREGALRHLIGTFNLDLSGNIKGGRLTVFGNSERTFDVISGRFQRIFTGENVPPPFAFAIVQLEDAFAGRGAAAAHNPRMVIFAQFEQNLQSRACSTICPPMGANFSGLRPIRMIGFLDIEDFPIAVLGVLSKPEPAVIGG